MTQQTIPVSPIGSTILALEQQYRVHEARDSSFAIVSIASSLARDPQDRAAFQTQRARQLKLVVRRLGHACHVLQGCGLGYGGPALETGRPDFASCVPEHLEEQPGEIFWISGISRDQTVELAKRFEPEGVLYTGQETGYKTVWLTGTGRTIQTFGQFSPHKLVSFWTLIKGQPFALLAGARQTRARHYVYSNRLDDKSIWAGVGIQDATELVRRAQAALSHLINKAAARNDVELSRLIRSIQSA